jgi:hypothetical protein
MPDEKEPSEHTYACSGCGKTANGRYVAGGWWQFPLGWLVHDAADRWVCSPSCGRELVDEDRAAIAVRRGSGERPSVHPSTTPRERAAGDGGDER